MQPLIWMMAVLLAAPVQDPVQVSASLTRDRITVGEATTLQVTVDTRSSAVDQFLMPSLPPQLEVLGTSDFSQTQISVPGGRTRVSRRDILLSSRTPGVYRIPAITVEVAGTRYRTSPLTLVVSAASGYSASPRPPGTSGAPAASTLAVMVSPDTVFVGQQVLLRAEVTFSDDVRSRQSRPASFDPPAPAGFWVQELPDPVTVVVRVRDGRPVESQTYRRAYFPLSAGEFVFPPAQLYYDVRRGFLSAPESRRLSSDSTRLVVLPLPQEGRPENFGGAVGRLEARASLRPQQIAVGEATVLEVELQGYGNVKGLPEPVLPPLPATEVFSPSQESRVEVVSERVGGTKRFRWVIVPQEPGELLIPPIEYSYFDPDLRQYVRLQTEPLELVAEPRPGAPRVAADTALRPLRTGRASEPAAWARSPLFAAAQLLPLLFVGATVVVRRRRQRPPGPREHERRIRNELARLRTRQPDAIALVELERLLHEMVDCLTHAAGQDSVSVLRAQQRADAADHLAGLLVDLQHARYAPGAAAPDMPRLVERAESLLRLLAPRRRWQRPAAAASSIIILCGGALLLHEPARAAAEDDPFTAGVASYQAGDWVRAANSFHEYTRVSPRDPNGWYNLGLAAQRANDPGRAVWAWLRALRIAPRDADVHHNLRLSDASAAIAEVRPLDRLATGERVVVAAAAWWLLVLAAGLAPRSGARRAAAGAAAALLVVAAVAAVASAARAPVITPLRTGAPLHAGPTVRDDQVGQLPVGALARILERRDDWLLVAAGPAGRAWVERSAVATP